MITQIAIMIFGASAIWFVTRKEEWKRWGYILGLLGQPFWIYESYNNAQWGILIMTLFYAYSWIQGIFNYWILPEIKKGAEKRIKKLKEEAAWEASKRARELKQANCKHVWYMGVCKKCQKRSW